MDCILIAYFIRLAPGLLVGSCDNKSGYYKVNNSIVDNWKMKTKITRLGDNIVWCQ